MGTQEKSIRISDKVWRKLTRWKLDFNFKSIDELIKRMLKIVNLRELEK